MNSEPVALTGTDVGQVRVPRVSRGFGKRQPRLVARCIGETELNAFCDLGMDGEVGSVTVVRGAEWVGLAWPDLHNVLFSLS
jgi:hypothetical protein